MGSGFIAYAIIMAIVFLVGETWVRRSGRSPEFWDSWYGYLVYQLQRLFLTVWFFSVITAWVSTHKLASHCTVLNNMS
jgi:hypothetical protein